MSKEQETQPKLCLGKTESIIINLDDESLNNMNEWCIKQHGASGLTKACRESKVSCAEAVRVGLRLEQWLLETFSVAQEVATKVTITMSPVLSVT